MICLIFLTIVNYNIGTISNLTGASAVFYNPSHIGLQTTENEVEFGLMSSHLVSFIGLSFTNRFGPGFLGTGFIAVSYTHLTLPTKA